MARSWPTRLEAQSPRRHSQLPRVGDRVRIRAPSIRDDRYVGRVEALPPRFDHARHGRRSAPSRLRHGAGARRGVPPCHDSRRTRFNRSTSAPDARTATSTIKGAIIGALGGAVLFGATNLPEVNPEFSDFLTGATVGVVVGRRRRRRRRLLVRRREVAVVLPRGSASAVARRSVSAGSIAARERLDGVSAPRIPEHPALHAVVVPGAHLRPAPPSRHIAAARA